MDNHPFEQAVYRLPKSLKLKNKRTFFPHLGGRSENILYYLKINLFWVSLLSGTKRIKPAVISFLRKKINSSVTEPRLRGGVKDEFDSFVF